MAILTPLVATFLALSASAGERVGEREAKIPSVPQSLQSQALAMPNAAALNVTLPPSVALAPSAAVAPAAAAPHAAAARPVPAADKTGQFALPLDETASKVHAAQKSDEKGETDGAAAAALGKLFDNAAAAEAKTDDPAADHAAQVDHHLAMAAALPALAAPRYYIRAGGVVRVMRKDEDRKTALKKILGQIEARAPKAVRELFTDAFALAKAGKLDVEQQSALFEAVSFWNAALEHGKGLKPIVNMAEAKLGLLELQDKAKSGADTSRWKLEFGTDFTQKPFKTRVNVYEREIAPPAAPAASPMGWTASQLAPPPPPPATFGEVYDAARAQGHGRLVSLWKAGVFQLKQGWMAVKSWFVGRDPYDREGPSAPPAPKGPDLKSPEMLALRDKLGAEVLLVHKPRKRSFLASGYRVHHADLGAGGQVSADQEISVKLARGGDDAQIGKLRARFDTFNALIEANFAALELIAQNPHGMTVKQARGVVEKVRVMADSFAKLTDDARERTTYIDAVDQLSAELERALKGLGDGSPVPASALELIVPLEKRSFHRLVNSLHQLALQRLGRGTDAGDAANLLVWLQRGEEVKQLGLIDLSNEPLSKGGRIVSPGFKALAEALAQAADTPKGALIMQDHQFWGHFKLGAHSAEMYANFLPPDEGGMIRLRYQEWGNDIYNQARLYYVGRTLEKLGFHVESDAGFLTAVVDKDHQSQSVDKMRESFSLIIQALHATVGLDFALPIILQGSTTSEESGRRIDEWVDIVLAEGVLPFYKHDDHVAMVAGFKDYAAQAGRRQTLKGALNGQLAEWGLPPIPAELPLGQHVIDKFFNEPAERALARGELRATGDGRVVRAKLYEPLRLLAASLAQESMSAARMAEAVGSLDPGLFDYETIGSIGALTVQRAQRRLDSDTWLNVYALRDPQTGQIGLARAELGRLDQAPKPLPPEAVFTLLAQQGHPVAAFKPSDAPPGAGHYLRKLRQTPLEERTTGTAFRGLAASPGPGRPVTAKVTFDKGVAAKTPSIFAAPYTSPDDLDAIRNSKAVVTTSGGLLSHAAITTREMGIGAVIFGQAEWKNGALVLRSDEFSKPMAVAGLSVRTVASRREVAVGEGDVVRVDPATGALEVFPETLRGVMLGLSRVLERYDADQDGAELELAVRRAMRNFQITNLQQLAIVREVLAEMTARVDAHPKAIGDLVAVRRALRDTAPSELQPLIAHTETSLVATERAAAIVAFRDLAEQVPEAASIPGVERLIASAEARFTRLTALAAAFDRPQAEGTVESSFDRVRDTAYARMEQLVRLDVKELEDHARLYPSATLEVLPRLKALVAKAKRRKLASEHVRRWEADLARLEAQRRESRAAQGPLVLPLTDVLDIDVGIVGGKGAKLGEVADVVERAGGKTAPGMALTIHAYREFIRRAGIEGKIDAIAKGPRTVEEKADAIQTLIRKAPLTADSAVGQVILQQLKAAGLSGMALAVRSSAVDEDGAEAAFAGAGDTHLFVDEAEVLEHVKDVWASLYNPRALLYRQTKGLAVTGIAQAVVVQAMVPSEVSGVAFTEDPVSGDTGRVIVNAAFGLGEGIVSGRVAPDQFVVSKRLGREMLPAMISDKKVAVVRKKGGKGVEEQRVAPERRRARSLSPSQLEKLATVASSLERHFGYALDIEFAFVGDNLYILQARPVTSAGAPQEAPAPAAPKNKAAPSVLFVCTGNTCRSPMAERLLKAEAGERGLDVQTFSRGLHAEDGGAINEEARRALAERGIDARDHQSYNLSAEDVKRATVILVMERRQLDEVVRRFPEAAGKTRVLAEYAFDDDVDVADPYGHSPFAYRRTADALQRAVSQVALKLGAEAAPSKN